MAASKKADCGESMLGRSPYGSARRRAFSMPRFISNLGLLMVDGRRRGGDALRSLGSSPQSLYTPLLLVCRGLGVSRKRVEAEETPLNV